MQTLAVVLSSAVVAAIVSPVASYYTQRRLSERQAEVQYRFDAAKRLYAALGPLQLQLLIACRDLARRVAAHPGRQWNMKTDSYYAKTFVYYIVRPLAVAELIQDQMNYADFSIDIAAVDLLRLKEGFDEMLSGDEVLTGTLQDKDWDIQAQHLFSGTLRGMALSLITGEEPRRRVMTYNEFAVTEADMGALSPLKVFFRRSSNPEGRGNLTALPLLWVRLVGYGYACARFTTEHGDVGIRPQSFPAAELIAAAGDDPVRKAATGIAARFDAVLKDAL